LSRRNASTPTFCSPIAFSIPAGVSQIRGGALPACGASDNPFVQIPPSLDKSTKSANSRP